MKHSFDLVVIGTGSAASAAAFPCASAKWKTAMIDSRPFGGTCALRGCDPKKVLVGAAEALDWSRRMAGKGIRAGDIRIDWPELMRFKRSFTGPLPRAREKGFADAGIAAFRGRARFVSRNAVQVGEDVLEGRFVLIATGAAPAPLRIPGEEFLATSDQFLDLDELPRRIVFVGGGYVAFEFAHIAVRAGANVTILHRGRHALERFDRGLVARLVEKTRRLGVDVRLETEVKKIERSGSAFQVAGIEADLVVHAAGRVPEIDGLDLAAAGVERGPRGVRVNEFLQSVSNPAVYAAGDAAGSGAPLTPVAGYDGRIVAANILEGNHSRPDYTATASVAFTIPPLASVGLQEEEARRQGLAFQVREGDTSGWYSSRRVAEDCSAYKVLLEGGSKRILGAHLLGPDAGEQINLFVLAMRARLPADALGDVLFAYPTHASDIRYMV